jgi:uncharacterized protein YndB with AHSA1/START domain
MRFIRFLLIGLVVLIALLAAVGLVLPDSAHVERSTVIEAPPDKVFAVVNNLRRFNEWSPWFDLDPDARYTFSGPESGVGSRVDWSSDVPSVGAGSQEIVASEAPRLVRTALDFGNDGTAFAEIRLLPENGATRVTWALDTELGRNPVDRYFGFFLDALLGPTYEDGLARLKRLVESGT